QHFRLLVVGGGAAGMGASHKFARKLPKFSVAVVEPNEIKGLPEAFDTPGVTSNYTPYLCSTNKELNTVTSGNCVFTFPNTPIKCAGAPQKVLYYGEEIVRNRGYRDKTNFIYATSLPR
ncbi:hypothetical protein TELCIR_19238, partial [Teladorsagia circumcincta]